ncbi:hypothetical protein H4R33_000406 [Dimargaris cristalligena]|uniref:tRNA N(3)-methylcytidine methyltransferase n=1 Tax=Dimargaris cristalligena TaxID=215637 RepID=A0A4P9ZR45_9FUNG|nr:hypothetical protein H4R33_000406 [Dimargaris cristalligena]RKP34900.1 S-adenosyl-L-methionine-dependent methyltransferase [Dimargaris cristalligena]|eukprot:RKP34900.1 S-adenosyl-L-methionine-dependent methyltransferase [Dimargaris cristalligena]
MTDTPKKETSSVLESQADPTASSTFGCRILRDEAEVFTQNAWDHAEWTEEQEDLARNKVELQKQNPVPLADQDQYNENPAQYWNEFYTRNENRFFKDRRWLRVEFPELFATPPADSADPDSLAEPPTSAPKSNGEIKEGAATKNPQDRFNVMEIGCGAGNAFFPLLAEHTHPDFFGYACDFSETAVQVVRDSPHYDPTRGEAFVWDLTSPHLPTQVQAGTIDVILLVFVMSAIHPGHWDQVMQNLNKLLRPGGIILFRDYGRYDMAQLRFKSKRLLSDNFYIRGDGTRVYFFTNEQLAELFGKYLLIEQNAVDRRLIVNRHRQIKMFRVWLQGKFRKPLTSSTK